MTITIEIQEAGYVDPRAGNDKFYRTFTIGSSWVTQYGRNGTIGTFTKLIDAGSPTAAQKAANAKFLSKIKKGYNPVRSGSLSTDTKITADNLALLDLMAEKLPTGTTTTVLTAPVNAIDLAQAPADDLTEQVRDKLTKAFESRPALDLDLNPALPMRPMLASMETPATIDRLMNDTRWFTQYKYDGDRVAIEVNGGEIRVLNRQGEQKVRNIGSHHLQPFTALRQGRWVFDGEVVGRTLVIFDLAAASDGVTTWIQESHMFIQRALVLMILSDLLGIQEVDEAPADAAVVLAPLAITTEKKHEMRQKAKDDKREGIILRDSTGRYESGRRSTGLIKHKFTKDADVIITGLHVDKQSATLSVYGSDGQLHEVGAASTIGKGDVNTDDVWMVTFLYVTDPDHPRLFQPRLVNKRHDKTAAECLLDQFLHAGTSKAV